MSVDAEIRIPMEMKQLPSRIIPIRLILSREALLAESSRSPKSIGKIKVVTLDNKRKNKPAANTHRWGLMNRNKRTNLFSPSPVIFCFGVSRSPDGVPCRAITMLQQS